MVTLKVDNVWTYHMFPEIVAQDTVPTDVKYVWCHHPKSYCKAKVQNKNYHFCKNGFNKLCLPNGRHTGTCPMLDMMCGYDIDA